MYLAEFFEQIYLPQRLRHRSPNTERLYRHSIRCLEATLGRRATLADLNDETVAAHLSPLTERLSPHSVNKERSQLLAIWNFAFRKRLIREPPNVDPEPTPERIPRAWMPEETGGDTGELARGSPDVERAAYRVRW